MVTVEFVDRLGSTEIRLTYERFSTSEISEQHEQGWNSSLDEGILAVCGYDWAHYLTSLKSYLETGQGMPHTE